MGNKSSSCLAQVFLLLDFPSSNLSKARAAYILLLQIVFLFPFWKRSPDGSPVQPYCSLCVPLPLVFMFWPRGSISPSFPFSSYSLPYCLTFLILPRDSCFWPGSHCYIFFSSHNHTQILDCCPQDILEHSSPKANLHFKYEHWH